MPQKHCIFSIKLAGEKFHLKIHPGFHPAFREGFHPAIREGCGSPATSPEQLCACSCWQPLERTITQTDEELTKNAPKRLGRPGPGRAGFGRAVFAGIACRQAKGLVAHGSSGTIPPHGHRTSNLGVRQKNSPSNFVFPPRFSSPKPPA